MMFQAQNNECCVSYSLVCRKLFGSSRCVFTAVLTLITAIAVLVLVVAVLVEPTPPPFALNTGDNKHKNANTRQKETTSK